MVRTLIQNDADPNLKGYGKSQLEWAQEKSKQDIVAYLQKIIKDKRKSKSVFSFWKNNSKSYVFLFISRSQIKHELY